MSYITIEAGFGLNTVNGHFGISIKSNGYINPLIRSDILDRLNQIVYKLRLDGVPISTSRHYNDLFTLTIQKNYAKSHIADIIGLFLQYDFNLYGISDIKTYGEGFFEVECSICGSIEDIEDSREFDDEYYCDDCFYDLYGRCEGCDEYFDKDDLSYIEGRGHYCPDCYEERLNRCDCCEELFEDSEMHFADNINVCHDCLENYDTCSSCNDLVHNDYSIYDEDRDETYCESCYQDLEDEEGVSLHQWNYKPYNFNFYGSNKFFYGIELELDKAGRDSNNAEKLLNVLESNSDQSEYYFCTDGSLNDGIELISHPRTLESHESYNWKAIFKKAIKLGYRSHNTSTCGLHVHVNRDIWTDKEITRLLLIFEKFWSKIMVFSRRKEEALKQWAKKLNYDSENESPADLLYKYKTNNRYCAINLKNTHTIEFRLFKGTLRLNSFIATLQFLEIINKIVFSDIAINDLDWNYILKEAEAFNELKTYLKERNLSETSLNQAINELIDNGTIQRTITDYIEVESVETDGEEESDENSRASGLGALFG